MTLAETAYSAVAIIDVDGTVSEDPSCWRAVHRFYGVSDGARRNYEDFLKHRDFPRWMRDDIGLWLEKKRPNRLHAGEIERIFSEPKLIPGAEELVRYLETERYLVVLATLGFSAAAYPISDALKVPRKNVYTNDFVLDTEGNLTGDGIARVYPYRKSQVARNVCKDNGMSLSQCVAITDTDWDRDLLEAASVGIAFCPKPEDPVRNVNGVRIVEEKNLRKVIEILEELKDK